jgi:hypothetical protein
MLEEGIIINRTHDTVLRFLPPYIVEKKHLDQAVQALDRVLVAALRQGVSRKEREPEEVIPDEVALAHA